MDRARGLSKQDRDDLLERIQQLLGESPKAKLVREVVESLPVADESPEGDHEKAAVPEAD